MPNLIKKSWTDSIYYAQNWLVTKKPDKKAIFHSEESNKITMNQIDISKFCNHGLRTPRESSFSKIWNFWAWADKLGCYFLRHLGYFRPKYQHYFGNESSLGESIWFFFLNKPLVFRSKNIYSSHIGRKEFGKEPYTSVFGACI